MTNRVAFMEKFIKLLVVKEFSAKMILLENKHLTPLYTDKMIMCLSHNEHSEDLLNFSLTGMRFLNEMDRTIEIYSVVGILSTLNDGRIIITKYDMQ